ncbi:MAG: hypothetical protein IPI33_17310 [Dehalococcoidia bacterium]|nr:hypothetical protein [Dehalococcoidia bacterium]
MWQALQTELSGTNFQVVSVAFESRGIEAALPYIEAAKPTYPCLIDREHAVAALYGMLNVPMAVWIDEDGQIVRPPEPAGSSDAFRRMDPATGRMAAEDVTELRATKAAYLDGLREWAHIGSRSSWALSPEEVRRRTAGPTAEQALARAHFQLGEYLWKHGAPIRARAHFDEAIVLHPKNWAYRRQAWDLEEQGKSMGPEFWKAVEALGERRYYPEIQTP